MSGIFESIRLAVVSALRSRRAVIAAVALVVPIALAAVLVWGLAPALSGAGAVPVAVVNLDEGGSVHAGEDLVDSLGDTTDLIWTEVDEDEATSGLERGTYALVVKIPENYSACVESVSGDDPQQATVEIISNGGENALATSAGSAVLKQVQSRLRADLGQDYLVSVLSDVQQEASRLTLTADGSTMLDAGFDGIVEGAGAISQGLSTTASGAEQLGSGLDQIAQGVEAAGSGAAALGQGLTAIRDQAAAPLAAGADALLSGLDTISSTAQSLGSGVEQVGGALSGVADALGQNMDDVAALGTAAGQIGQQGEALSQALSSVTEPMGEVATAAATVSGGVTAASEGAKAVSDAAAALAGELSCEDEQAPGIVEQAKALDAAEDELVAQLREVASDAELSAEDRAARVEEIDAQLTELASERDALGERLQAASDTATGLVATAGSSVEALDGAVAANEDLVAATQRFGEATAGVSEPVEGLVRAATSAATSAGSLARGVATAQATLAGVGEAGTAGYTPGLADTVATLGRGVSALAGQLSSTGAVGSGVSALATGASALGEALTPMAEATGQLASGNAALAEALSGVAGGASGLGEGIAAMATATDQLADGAGQLGDATAQIADSMVEAGDTLSDVSRDRSERAEVAARPVAFTTTRVAPVSSATQVAPAILVSALWLGSILACAIMPVLDMRAVAAGRYGQAVLAPLVSLGVFSIVQAALGMVVLMLAGVSVGNLAATAVLLIVCALAFAMIAQALRIWFGRAATPVALGLLALQLACANSVVPASLSAGPLQMLGDALPVPVLVDALRRALAGVTAGVGTALVALAVFALIALCCSGLRARRRSLVRI